ncbi:hypothetical protein LY78DRAFT_486702 [Colletotrichum sublineola]|nr:hypothetical protein LY78DRAFT_486702 [Colletotrichum sublineola]
MASGGSLSPVMRWGYCFFGLAGSLISCFAEWIRYEAMTSIVLSNKWLCSAHCLGMWPWYLFWGCDCRPEARRRLRIRDGGNSISGLQSGVSVCLRACSATGQTNVVGCFDCLSRGLSSLFLVSPSVILNILSSTHHTGEI